MENYWLPKTSINVRGEPLEEAVSGWKISRRESKPHTATATLFQPNQKFLRYGRAEAEIYPIIGSRYVTTWGEDALSA